MRERSSFPGRGPARAAPGPAGRDRRPIVVIGGDPSIERFHLFGRTTIAVLTAALAASVGLTIISAAQTPIGWAITALAAAIALVVPTAWHRLQSKGGTKLPVWQLAPRWAEPVAKAAIQAERLRQLAERSPVGPIADHFDRLATTAEGYVVALHHAATSADAAAGGDRSVTDPELERDMRRIIGGLTELVEAAEALRAAQRRHLETSPIADLTAETERLTATIEAGVDRLDTPDPDAR